MRKLLVLLLLVMLALSHAACSGGTGEPVASASVGTTQNSAAPVSPITVEYDADDLDATAGVSRSAAIELAGDTITVNGTGAKASGSVVTITAAGTYTIHGTLADGQIVVDSADEGTIRLILSGVDVACSTSAPLHVANAEKVVLTLAAGTENRVTDGPAYVYADAQSDEPNAAVFSHDDLTINGGGSLTVNANYNNGIASKDDLKITGGDITVNAVNDGIKGKDSVVIRDGTLTVNAGADGLQAHNDVDAAEGYIVVEGGTLRITAGLDGIQAETRLAISGGDITVTAGGGSGAALAGNPGGGWDRGGSAMSDAASIKGLKAGVDVTITGGTLYVDAADDALHSNDSLTIGGGALVLSSGDDGVHAETTLVIGGGDVRIDQSYEGLESASITILGGSIHVTASDDGVNASSGGGMGMAGRPGQAGFAGSNTLYVHDGYLYVDAGGDGLDVNGPIEMTGGTVIVNGPTSNMNGAVDYTGGFKLTGGFFVAVGSAGMAQAPDTSSTQYAVMVNLPSAQPGGTMVHIAAQDGQNILALVPTKAYQSVVVSSPDLAKGMTYAVYTGGSSTGTAADGLYTGGTYTAGTQAASFTISSIVTGSGGGGFPGGPGGGGGGRPRP